MLKNCAAYGITPLTREEFETEDKRMLMEMVNKRNGLYEFSGLLSRNIDPHQQFDFSTYR